MKIVADENISLVEEVFSSHGTVTCLPGRKMTAADVRDADVLLVRSVTPVNASLLSGSKVKFVGTCTIGTDHLDTAWLDAQGIHWASAPGCNADAVVDYVLACMAGLGLEFQQLPDSGFTVGIVGCGNVGSRLHKRLDKLGIATLCCDPFKRSKRYVSLETVISGSDMVCLHTPLTTGGKHPTRHLINGNNLLQFKQNAILLNAGRGAVIDNAALFQHMHCNRDFRVVLDVWENEPDIMRQLLQQVAVGTPHIAGYSVEGKQRGTEMIYEEFCRYFNIRQPVAVAKEAPLEFDARHFASLRELVLAGYDPVKDSDELKQAPQSFDQLRKLYIYRREFSGCVVRKAPSGWRLPLKALGFRLNR